MKRLLILAFVVLPLILLLCLPSCNTQEKKATQIQNQAKGKLFIIGGGKRPPGLIKTLIQEAQLQADDYIIVLPMSSSVPDTSFFYAKKQFVEQGYKNVFNYYFAEGDHLPSSRHDSLKNAKLVYISGGDQNRFMKIIDGTPVSDLIHACYKQGGVIAGTSAGAAVMSEKMITGNELKHPQYEETFRNIEAQNIEIAKGLGLVTNAIIDQHFIKRSRYNRLITSAIEYPKLKMIGIDESTAIIVDGDSAEVTGLSQVILIEKPLHIKTQDGLLGAKDIKLSVLLPGEKFKL